MSGKISQAKRAYEALRQDIIRRVLPPGYPVSEVEMAERLGMSRTPVREALSELRAEGLIERVRGRGSVVKSLTREETKQAFEFAESLEAMCAYLVAAEPADRKAIGRMEKSVADMEKAFEAQDGDGWAAADEAFHQALHGCCRNKYIIAALHSVDGNVYYTRMLITKILLDKALSTQEHRETLEMIKERNAEGARSAMTRHWSRIRGEVLKFIMD